MQHADLGGGEADPERVVHQLAHPRDLLAQRVVEALDRPRLGAQHRVAEVADLGQGGVAARGGLGIELGFRLGFGFGPGLGVGVGLEPRLGSGSVRLGLRIGLGETSVSGHLIAASLRVDVDAHADPAA